MKELSHEEIQRLAEQGELSNVTLDPKQVQDVKAYQTLFNELKVEPADGLSFGFAAKVRRVVQQRVYRKNELKYNLVLTLIFILISTSAYGFLYLISPMAAEQLWTAVQEFKWGIGTAFLLFWSIQFGSKLLLKERRYY